MVRPGISFQLNVPVSYFNQIRSANNSRTSSDFERGNTELATFCKVSNHRLNSYSFYIYSKNFIQSDTEIKKSFESGVSSKPRAKSWCSTILGIIAGPWHGWTSSEQFNIRKRPSQFKYFEKIRRKYFY